MSNVKEWSRRDRAQPNNPDERQYLPLPPVGEWNDEPDKIQWIDDATGLDCLMHRSPSGAWCGYVGVAEGHPAFGKDYDGVDVEVHGGLTYAEFCMDTGDESYGICHVPEPGRPHRVWWLGFDCAHAGDMTPAHDALPGMAEIRERYPRNEVYRNRAYVEHEVAELARQLKEMSA
jgi:hypothetical protein